jgi:S-adenosylmethionine synthetase
MLYTAESVTPYHPDKICDQISDLILDYLLEADPLSRVAVDCLGGHRKIFISGEVTSHKKLDVKAIRTRIIRLFPHLKGYTIEFNLARQSPQIKQGVDTGGAGDQGIMIGYACDGNPEYVPQEYYLARKLCRYLFEHVLKTDGKTQVTLDDKGGIEAVVASFQNIKRAKLEAIVKKVIPGAKKYFINPAGDWDIGGFDADTGLTGRKIAVDNYGPRIQVGGGCFSGKDATKVDRSAAYMARRIALDLLKGRNDRHEVLVKLAYSIGKAEPVMAVAIIDGKEKEIKGYDLSPQGIIKYLELRKPVYTETAQWGHMGKGFKWG